MAGLKPQTFKSYGGGGWGGGGGKKKQKNHTQLNHNISIFVQAKQKSKRVLLVLQSTTVLGKYSSIIRSKHKDRQDALMLNGIPRSCVF